MRLENSCPAAPHDILNLGRCTCNVPKAPGISGGVVVPLAARLSPLTTNEAIEKGAAFYRPSTSATFRPPSTNSTTRRRNSGGERSPTSPFTALSTAALQIQRRTLLLYSRYWSPNFRSRYSSSCMIAPRSRATSITGSRHNIQTSFTRTAIPA